MTEPTTTSTSRGASSPTSIASDEHVAPERTLGQLVADASHDLSSILRSEVALAKAELKADVTAVALGAAMFAVAGVLAFLALILLLIAAAYGLVAAGLAPWLAFLIVAGALLLITLLLALIGKSRFGRAGPPERTLRSTRETVAALKGVKPRGK